MQDVSVVLVHRAWADGTSWARVITALKADGAKVSAVPLPLISLSDDVAALNRTLERTQGPVVLAAHAYAGAVIALARPERVKALVYVTALAPAEGEKVADVFYRLEPHPKAPKLAPDSNGLIWLPDEAFANAFAQNASPDQRAVLAAVQRPISVNCITAPVRRPLWKDIPKLVSDCRGRPHDRPADAALYSGAHEGEDKGAHSRSDIIRDAIRFVTDN